MISPWRIPVKAAPADSKAAMAESNSGIRVWLISAGESSVVTTKRFTPALRAVIASFDIEDRGRSKAIHAVAPSSKVLSCSSDWTSASAKSKTLRSPLYLAVRVRNLFLDAGTSFVARTTELQLACDRGNQFTTENAIFTRIKRPVR